MKKREINIDEFTPKDIEELKVENIDLRVMNSKLLNDNFLLASHNVKLQKEINDFKKAMLLLKDWFETQVAKRPFPINTVPEEIRKLMVQDGNND